MQNGLNFYILLSKNGTNLHIFTKLCPFCPYIDERKKGARLNLSGMLSGVSFVVAAVALYI